MTETDDARFAEAEADVERGESWRFREDDAPNPLTIAVTGWTNGHTKLGDREFMNCVDRHGKSWTVLVGSVVLKKRLVEGLVEEWSDEQGGYLVVETQGRAQAGEVVSIKYASAGERASGNECPKFTVSRKRATPPSDEPTKGAGDDGLPF